MEGILGWIAALLAVLITIKLSNTAFSDNGIWWQLYYDDSTSSIYPRQILR